MNSPIAAFPGLGRGTPSFREHTASKERHVLGSLLEGARPHPTANHLTHLCLKLLIYRMWVAGLIPNSRSCGELNEGINKLPVPCRRSVYPGDSDGVSSMVGWQLPVIGGEILERGEKLRVKIK